MDFHLKQWRNQQHESDNNHHHHHHHHQQTPAKIPKLLLEPQQQQQHSSGSAAALPLFVPEPNNSHLSAFPDLTPTTPTIFPRMASYFSLAQWQELELQALIFRYMLAGADVPAELLHPIKKSLLSNTPYYLHHSPLHHYPYYQPSLVQPGYWGRGAMDPEPGRCRRTDGKKWRCSRDVVDGRKYCERHMNRGRNRSRKPVEIQTPTHATAIISGGNGGGVSSGDCGTAKTITPLIAAPPLAVSGGTHFALSGPSSSIDLLQLNQSSSEPMTENKSLFEPQNEKLSSGDGRSDGRTLRCFFDDWPRSLQEPDNATGSNAGSMASSAGLSMSIPGNSSSDISLKLSTGTGDDYDSRERPHLNWAAGWGMPPVAPMGGPLAEALRSSASNSAASPTSVLHELQRGSASETSFVSS